jgi:AAA+ superfamily predicted ATPase
MSAHGMDWVDANHRALLDAIAAVRARLEGGPPPEPVADPPLAPRPAHESLRDALALSPFEHGILLLCAGIELDPTFPRLCAAYHRDAQRAYPTFRMALDLLPDPHWSALTPAAPLRYWRLIEIVPGDSLTASPLRIDERTLHHLTGIAYLDSRIRALFEPVALPAALPESYRGYALQIAELWSDPNSTRPIVQLEANGATASLIAAAGCAAIGLRLHAVRASRLPQSAGEIESVARLWEREALFGGSALLVEDDAAGDPGSLRCARDLVESVQGFLLTTGGLAPQSGRRATRRIGIGPANPAEQRGFWLHALGPAAYRLNGRLDEVVAQFLLEPDAILAAGSDLRDRLQTAEPGLLADAVWERCRLEARSPLAQLAERIESSVGWDDLVLPDEQVRGLRQIAMHVRRRTRVYEQWGFAARSGRGLGISALFAGPSGVGKTLAAEVLANDLRLDLFKIDLSQVVSKYIGETERNLRTLFDAAERSGAILLFDEADALFGRRSEVKDSHDRYANVEVSYLLQRMESYRGLAILTTNQRAALDTAFLRRQRFIVTFPCPDATQRAAIWKRVFPEPTPREGLDPARLARLSVSGGNIRNIALHAAFLAAEEQTPVRMSHLLQAAKGECAKIEKPLTVAEIGDWA